MHAVVKLYIEGIGKPFCELHMNRITKRTLDSVISNAQEWLQIVSEQAGTPIKHMACERCADLIEILKYVLKVKNINNFPQEKETINELIKKFADLQAKTK